MFSFARHAVGKHSAVAIFALATGVTSLALADGKVAGVVTYAEGDVFRSDKEAGPFRKLKVDSEIFEGDVLKTEAGRLEARLLDRSVIRLSANSRLKLDQARFAKEDDGDKKFTAKLFFGRMWAKVTSIVGSDSKFEVSSPNAVAGVRGTQFNIDVGKDKSTTVKVFTGKVLVSNKPTFYVEGTKKFDGSQKPGERKQVAGPQEVSKKQWEESIAGALQEVRVAANGALEPAEAFAQAKGDDEWLAWNQKRDEQ